MANYFNAHIGPFLKIIPTKIERKEEIFSCPKVDCSQHGNEFSGGAYCNFCATKLSNIEKIVIDDAVDYWEITEKLDESFWQPPVEFPDNKAYVLLPNHYRNRLRDYSVSEYDDPSIQINIDKEKDMEIFLKDFEHDIKVLKEAFGENCVQPMWGVVSYYH